jgi:hypothetical protein
MLIVSLALLLLMPTTVAASGRTAAAPAAPASNVGLLPCTRTVNGFTAAAVHAARDAAGVGGAVCFPAGTYSGNLTMSVARQQWQLADGSVLTGTVNLTGYKVVLYNGQISRSGSDRWMASVQVRADETTVESVVFKGGGTGVGVYGRDRNRIIYNDFRELTGSAVSLWGESGGSDDTLVMGNTIVQTKTYRVSPITSRGNDGDGHSGVQNMRANIRSNVIDQGSGDIGWFGIELKQSKGALVERNRISGGKVLMSLPETDSAIVRQNVFDVRGTPFWAIEVGNAWDVVIGENEFWGDGPNGVDYGVSQNTNPLRTGVWYNKVRNMRTLIGIAGDGHRIINNCLSNVANVTEFMLNGKNVTVSGNKTC